MYIKLLIVLILLFIPKISYWITFDSNISTISIKNKYINFNSYISPNEINQILTKNKIIIESYEDHIINQDLIKKYYEKNINIKNCKIDSSKVIDKEEYINNIHEKWFRINLKYLCWDKINNLNFSINTFKDFPNQKYSISIYNLNKSNNKILYRVLTKHNKKLIIKNLDKFSDKKTKDSDCDWLNDEEEKIYWTNPLKQDTDWDNYSDFEEVQAALEPLNKILWPWQNYRASLPYVKCNIENTEIIEKLCFKK